MDYIILMVISLAIGFAIGYAKGKAYAARKVLDLRWEGMDTEEELERM